jgi:acetyltransferase-like isoleucine patch superfamily enzyme
MIKKIVHRLLGKRGSDRTSAAMTYLLNGNLSVGKNTNLEKLNVQIFGAKKGQLNIEIGDDCMLEGNLVLYSPESKIKIGNRTYIGGGTSLYAYEKIVVGDDVMISWDCSIIDTNAHSLDSGERANDVLNWKKGWAHKDWSVVESRQITIGDKSWIGFSSIIMKGVALAEGCIVAAGSVVSKSFGSFSVIGGNPAEFIKKTT